MSTKKNLNMFVYICMFFTTLAGPWMFLTNLDWLERNFLLIIGLVSAGTIFVMLRAWTPLVAILAIATALALYVGDPRSLLVFFVLINSVIMGTLLIALTCAGLMERPTSH